MLKRKSKILRIGVFSPISCMLVVFSASIVGVRPVCFLPIEARRLRAQVDLERTGKFFRHWVLEV